MRTRTFIFLTSSFLSAIGDTLLEVAVPAGFGLETKDIRSAVLMWLIPAVAIYLSSFFKNIMISRANSIRTDYAKLLLSVSILEIIISFCSLELRSSAQTLVLITLFVFLYALAKEGIPRLLYLVAVYRFFIEPEGYTKIAGKNTGLNILAEFIGTVIAAFLVVRGHWRVSLVLDALSFVVFGLAIYYCGIDPNKKNTLKNNETENNIISEKSKSIIVNYIPVVVPLIFAVNALVWNYLPLLSEQILHFNAFHSILLISFLRIPGLFSGFFLSKISKFITIEHLIQTIPVLYIIFSLFFVLRPSFFSLSLLIIGNGIVSGAYWSADYSIRNKLNHTILVQYNTTVLRRLAIFQFIACCFAVFLYSPEKPLGIIFVPFIMIGLIIFSILTNHSKKIMYFNH